MGGLLFEAIPGTLERPILHEVVSIVWVLLQIESSIEVVGEGAMESVGGGVCPKSEAFLSVGMAWVMVRIKSGIARVEASISPSPPWDIVIYKIRSEFWGIEVCHVRQARKELTMESIPTSRGAPNNSTICSWSWRRST